MNVTPMSASTSKKKWECSSDSITSQAASGEKLLQNHVHKSIASNYVDYYECVAADLVKVTSPSLGPMTESWAGKGKSAAKKNKTFSICPPSCCPLLGSNMQNFNASLGLLIAADDKPILQLPCH